jgi:hypothetical protein
LFFFTFLFKKNIYFFKIDFYYYINNISDFLFLFNLFFALLECVFVDISVTRVLVRADSPLTRRQQRERTSTWILFTSLALKSGPKNLTWKDAVMVMRSGPLPPIPRVMVVGVTGPRTEHFTFSDYLWTCLQWSIENVWVILANFA